MEDLALLPYLFTQLFIYQYGLTVLLFYSLGSNPILATGSSFGLALLSF